MSKVAPLEIYSDTVIADWIDYNGHMNVAYYVLLFDHGTDAFFDYLGVGNTYIDETNHSFFAAELHVTYLHELMQGDELRVTTQLLDCDEKRVHFFHRMYNAKTGDLSATYEVIGLHVNMSHRRVTPMPGDTQVRLEKLRKSHSQLSKPIQAGHIIGIKA